MTSKPSVVNIAVLPLEKRLEEVFTRTLPKIGPEARQQLAAIITPAALTMIASVLVAWVVGHAFGVGEIIDVIILVVGVFALGMAVFGGLDHLYAFAAGTYFAKSARDVDVAADHLAKAIGILGIQAVLAVLFRAVPITGRSPRYVAPLPAPSTPGLRYRPTITNDPLRKAGTGETNHWGDITISTRGTANDYELALLHEKVHQFFTPSLYILRKFRVENMASSYARSSLWRYMEEALAETISRVGVNGIRQFFIGVRFPVKNGYVYLNRSGGFNPLMGGRGLVPEGAALLSSGMIMGISFQMWFSPR